jgi:predicted TIM-barrel fold metal-dependent hydrolase
MANAPEVIISADSHVNEPGQLWVSELPVKFKDVAPRFAERGTDAGSGRFQFKTGGWDPRARINDMSEDGVSAEVLYPSSALTLFGLDDAELQEACFRVYNDWIIEYCRAVPDRLWGVGCISLYNIDHAITELERCKDQGLRGALIWQAPHPDLPLRSEHYERFWAAAASLDMPLSMHILTGFNHTKGPRLQSVEHYRGTVNFKAFEVVTALFDLIFYGILHRYPRLKVVTVEAEIGWIPFFLQQWDYYYRRFRDNYPAPMDGTPSDYFYRQIYATFMDDPAGGQNFNWWAGVNNCMWSNDYPHRNSTWPHSREAIARELAHVSDEARRKLLCENAARFYGIEVPPPVPLLAG